MRARLRLAGVVVALSACGGGGGGGGDAGADAAPGSDATQPDVAGPAADIVENFASYTDTAHFLSDPSGLYRTVEDFYEGGPNGGAGTIALDTTVGYGDSAQSMLYTWTPTATPSEGGTISRLLSLPDNTQEVWVEVVVRFASDYRISNEYTGGAAYKFLFVTVNGTSGRFGVQFEHGDDGAMSIEGPTGAAATYEDAYDSNGTYGIGDHFTDEEWHVVRYHVAPTLHELWVDGTSILQRTGLTQSWSDVWGVALGRNMNMQPLIAQRQWWGRASIWLSDPGW